MHAAVSAGAVACGVWSKCAGCTRIIGLVPLTFSLAATYSGSMPLSCAMSDSSLPSSCVSMEIVSLLAVALNPHRSYTRTMCDRSSGSMASIVATSCTASPPNAELPAAAAAPPVAPSALRGLLEPRAPPPPPPAPTAADNVVAPVLPNAAAPAAAVAAGAAARPLAAPLAATPAAPPAAEATAAAATPPAPPAADDAPAAATAAAASPPPSIFRRKAAALLSSATSCACSAAILSSSTADWRAIVAAVSSYWVRNSSSCCSVSWQFWMRNKLSSSSCPKMSSSCCGRTKYIGSSSSSSSSSSMSALSAVLAGKPSLPSNVDTPAPPRRPLAEPLVLLSAAFFRSDTRGSSSNRGAGGINDSTSAGMSTFGSTLPCFSASLRSACTGIIGSRRN